MEHTKGARTYQFFALQSGILYGSKFMKMIGNFIYFNEQRVIAYLVARIIDCRMICTNYFLQ